MRLTGAMLLAFLATPAFAGTPERNTAWTKLIETAKAHGGVETTLDKTASYVFQINDGDYLSLTRFLTTDVGRSVCLIAKEQNATACVDWDSGKLTLGDRADAASPWRFKSLKSLATFEAQQPGLGEKLLSFLGNLIGGGGKGSRGGSGYYRLSRNGNWYWAKD